MLHDLRANSFLNRLVCTQWSLDDNASEDTHLDILLSLHIHPQQCHTSDKQWALRMSFSFTATTADQHGTHHSSPNSMHHQQYLTPLPGSSSSSAGGSPTANAQVQAAAAAAAAAQAAANMPLLASIANVKDSRWLTLEVCREYQRGKCTRSEQECKFAHPPTHVEVNSGKVIACFDSLKVRLSTSHWRSRSPEWLTCEQESVCLQSVIFKNLSIFTEDIYLLIVDVLVVKLIQIVQIDRKRPIIILICVDFVYRIMHSLARWPLCLNIHWVECVASITTFRAKEISCAHRLARWFLRLLRFKSSFTRFTSHFIVMHCIPLVKRAMQTEKNKREKESETSDRTEASYQSERERERKENDEQIETTDNLQFICIVSLLDQLSSTCPIHRQCSFTMKRHHWEGESEKSGDASWTSKWERSQALKLICPFFFPWKYATSVFSYLTHTNKSGDRFHSAGLTIARSRGP